MDAFHLAQADGVHRLGRQVEGGEVAHLEGVQRAPVGQVRRGDGGARVRDVVVAHEGEEIAVGRHHGVADGGPAGLAQPLALALGHRRREARERFPEDAASDVVDDVHGDRIGEAPHHHARQGVAGGDALAQQLGVLARVGREGAQPRDVVVVVLQGGERHLLGQPREIGVRPRR